MSDNSWTGGRTAQQMNDDWSKASLAHRAEILELKELLRGAMVEWRDWLDDSWGMHPSKGMEDAAALWARCVEKVGDPTGGE